MITSLSLVLAFIFTVLGAFHFYWLFGGTWGLRQVIPRKSSESKPLAIPSFATLIVALVLISFGLLYLIKSGLITVHLPNYISNYGYWLIPSIFILRAIGEFNYVGFFKKITNTDFAKADTKIFSPLCLGIGVIGYFIVLLD